MDVHFLRWRPLLALSCMLFALGWLLSIPAAPASAAPKTPRLNWSACYQDWGRYECATLKVPLDHSAPNGATISIAVIKQPATDPARRIGSIVFNPGGPGGSGIDFVLYVGSIAYSPELRARFDYIGFDPRGIGRSTPLRCFGTFNQMVDAYGTPFPFPTSAAEEEYWIAADTRMVDACEQRGGQIMSHMSTANVARDMDLLRQALGDQQLSYVGLSYGTFLGTTYANLFPDKVRAMVLDGVLDPIAWTTGYGDSATQPFSTRLRSDASAMSTLQEFFRLCDAGGQNCAFAGNAAERYAALATQLHTAPILISNPDGSSQSFGYSNLIAQTLNAMYDPYSWPAFAELLLSIEAQAMPQTLGAKLANFRSNLGLVTKRGFPHYPNYGEGFPGVACSDSDNPDSPAAWSAAAAAAEATYGYFGPIWTWSSSICASWPGPAASRYAGPWNAQTATPVVVIGNSYDPATRYEGAVTVAGLLPNARLITMTGWGHVSLFWSECADNAASDYLLNQTLPPAGLTCAPNDIPFATSASSMSTDAQGFRARFTRTVLLETVNPRRK